MKDSVILGLVAIVAGIVVLAWDDAIQWTVGIFLLVWGVISLLGLGKK